MDQKAKNTFSKTVTSLYFPIQNAFLAPRDSCTLRQPYTKSTKTQVPNSYRRSTIEREAPNIQASDLRKTQGLDKLDQEINCFFEKRHSRPTGGKTQNVHIFKASKAKSARVTRTFFFGEFLLFSKHLKQKSIEIAEKMILRVKLLFSLNCVNFGNLPLSFYNKKRDALSARSKISPTPNSQPPTLTPNP